MKVDCVIVAAGSSSRFGADKLFADLEGRPVLSWSLSAYAAAPMVKHIVLVCPPGRESSFERAGRWSIGRRLSAVVAGGPRRRDSVEAGLTVCDTRYVVIHDCARPLIFSDVIARVMTAADGKPGAIAAIPVTDTIKEARDGIITGHPDRALLWAAQTPQVVLRQAWLDAAATSDNDETDDAAMLARLGLECAIVEGDPDNIKITRPLDLELARAILRSRSAQ